MDCICHHRKIPHPGKLAVTSLQLWTRCEASICCALAPAAVVVSLRSGMGEGFGKIHKSREPEPRVLLPPIPPAPCWLVNMPFQDELSLLGIHLVW